MQSNTETKPNLTAANLRKLRQFAGLTMEMVNKKIPELSPSALSRIEQGLDGVPESLGLRLIELYKPNDYSASGPAAIMERALFLAARIGSDSTELNSLLSTMNQGTVCDPQKPQ